MNTSLYLTERSDEAADHCFQSSPSTATTKEKSFLRHLWLFWLTLLVAVPNSSPVMAQECDASGSPQEGPVGTIATFTSVSSPCTTRGYEWSLLSPSGDREFFAYTQTWTHTLDEEGDWRWSLKTFGDPCNCVITAAIRIGPATAPCSITANALVPKSAKPGEAVEFKDDSTVTGSCRDPVYAWYFGEGDVEFGTNPMHIYATKGTYTWRLTVTSGLVTGTATGTIAIAETCSLIDCKILALAGDPSFPTNFTATYRTEPECPSLWEPNTYWNFGDGQTDAGLDHLNVSHQYSYLGTFVVTMVAQMATFTESAECFATKEIFIEDFFGGGATDFSPSLKPYTPANWSDNAVVSNQTGTTTDYGPLYTTDSVYVDFAVLNTSGMDINSRFYVSLFFDGVFKSIWYSDSLASNHYTYVKDYSLGQLTAGTHRVRILYDSNSAINSTGKAVEYVKTFHVFPGADVRGNLPNLVPYKPNKWSDALVVSNKKNDFEGNATYSNKKILYVNWAVANDGPAEASGPFYVDVYIDGLFKHRWIRKSTVMPGYWLVLKNYPLGRLPAGAHSLKLFADASLGVSENKEFDNEYVKNIRVNGTESYRELPNLAPAQVAGWPDKIVVSASSKASAGGESFTSQQALYIGWAVLNSGKGGTGTRFFADLYVDGVLKKTWKIPPLKARSYHVKQHYAIGKLGEGKHTFTVLIDPRNALAEDNDGDNQYSKTIEITSAP